MIVVFEFTMDRGRVQAVHWEEGDCMVGKTLMQDGSIRDERREDCPNLSELTREVAGGQGQAYTAEVDDVRSAMKYLGKSADLAMMLPHARVHDNASREDLPEIDDPSENIFKPGTI